MGDLTIRVQGLVDRIETVPDGKYVHIWIKEAQKPLTITANELEKGFKPKPGERIWAEANEGKKWLFIKRYGRLAETRVGLPPSPVRYWQPEYPPQDSPVNPGYYPEFPVDRILSSRFSFRQDITEGIQDLISEIHAAGLIIQPLICRPSSKPGHVEIGPGERRLYAARQLGMKTVPIVVKAFSDFEFDKLRLLENIARKDLTDMETARVLKYLMEKYAREYPTQETLADAFAKTQHWVSQHLAMLNLEQDQNITRVISIEKLSERQAREILSVPAEKRAEVGEKIAQHIKADGEIPSAREIRKIAWPEAEDQFTQLGKPDEHTVAKLGEAEKPNSGPVQSEKKPRREESEKCFIFDCPDCNGQTFMVIHVGPDRHRVEPVTVIGEKASA